MKMKPRELKLRCLLERAAAGEQLRAREYRQIRKTLGCKLGQEWRLIHPTPRNFRHPTTGRWMVRQGRLRPLPPIRLRPEIARAYLEHYYRGHEVLPESEDGSLILDAREDEAAVDVAGRPAGQHGGDA